MSASPANPKSLHGFPTRVTQVSAKTTDFNPKSETKSERISASASGSPSTETVAVVANRAVASRSSRQPRLSFSSFAPSSENDYPKKVKSPTRGGEGEEEEEEKRKWNLRPRKGFGGGGGGGGGGASSEVKNQKPSGGGEAKSNRQRGIPAESPGLGGGVEVVTNENHRLWIALSRDEIEEDLFSMSGNRASRRPRKRTKTLQKYLDVIFPGLCLVGMNADCFRVSNSPSKR